MAAAGLVYALGGNAAQAATAEGVAWATTPLQVYAAKRAYESYGNPSTPPRKRPKAQLDWTPQKSRPPKKNIFETIKSLDP